MGASPQSRLSQPHLALELLIVGFPKHELLDRLRLNPKSTIGLFALPAVYTIDTYGRRNLLLTTFPLVCTLYAI